MKTTPGESETNPWPARCRLARERHGLTQAQAAERMGVSVSGWVKWELGLRTPRGAAATLFGVRFGDDLIRG